MIPPSGASPYDTIYWLIPKNKKKPAKPIILDFAGIVPCSGAGLFLVHELLEGNPVLDRDSNHNRSPSMTAGSYALIAATAS